MLLTKYAYHGESGTDQDGSGRLLSVTDPKGTVERHLYDDLGRETYLIANYVNFASSTEANTGGGSKNDEDQVIKNEYDGLDNLTAPTALDRDGDGGSNDEATTYEYADGYDASLVTETTYPDSTGAGDVVTFTYFLDGVLKSQNDQRDVTIDYTYVAKEGRRRVEWQKATIPGGSGVDGAVKGIKRTYDSKGRLELVTSYADTTGTTALNEIKYTYKASGVPGDYIEYDVQEHNGVADVYTPYVRYYYDTTATSSAFDDGVRLYRVDYPSGKYVQRYFDGTRDDALHRVSRLKGNHGASLVDLVEYEYSGTSRLMRTEYSTPGVVSEYDLGPDGTYEFLDRFGRIKTKDWRKSSTIKDQFTYTHDYAGNRLTRDIPSSLYSANDKDHVYTYDGRHRLATSTKGTLSGSIDIGHAGGRTGLDA